MVKGTLVKLTRPNTLVVVLEHTSLGYSCEEEWGHHHLLGGWPHAHWWEIYSNIFVLEDENVGENIFCEGE